MIQREIERCGIATTSISLVREFTLKVRPPRALWVPFPFGRPFGAPNDPGIQQRVLLATLALLDYPEPILDDFTLPENWQYLDAKYQAVGRSCGAKGCNLEESLSDSDGAGTALSAYHGDFNEIRTEIESLMSAHRRYRESYHGRTQIGQSGVDPETIVRAAEIVDRFIAGDAVDRLKVRLSIDDLKAYYLESRLGMDESAAVSAAAANDWLWLDTQIAAMLAAARDRLVATTDATDDPNWILSRGIVPRGYGSSGYALTHVVE